MILLGFTGLCVAQAMATAWVWLAMFFHGIVIVHLFSLQHECVHYTVFRTRWLNDVVGSLCGWIIVVPNRFFRYEHCNHHTFTNLKSKDPELIELPGTLREYILYLSSWPYWKGKILQILRHVGGRINVDEAAFVPHEEWVTIILEARIISLGYLAVVGLCASTDWWAPLWYWWLPLLLGEPGSGKSTLARLSKRSGVSAAMISRIETGQSSASLSSLQQIAAALSVPVISLFEHTLVSSDINFVRADEGLNTVRVTAEESHWYNILGKHDNSSMSFTASSITLRKSDRARFPVYQGGGFIFLYAREGSAIYRCGDQRFEMSTGDTLSFDARLSNGFESLISETFSFISVFAQPL